jgi:hypothetical protein
MKVEKYMYFFKKRRKKLQVISVMRLIKRIYRNFVIFSMSADLCGYRGICGTRMGSRKKIPPWGGMGNKFGGVTKTEEPSFAQFLPR